VHDVAPESPWLGHTLHSLWWGEWSRKYICHVYYHFCNVPDYGVGQSLMFCVCVGLCLYLAQTTILVTQNKMPRL
jgi:hypothetical protein